MEGQNGQEGQGAIHILEHTQTAHTDAGVRAASPVIFYVNTPAAVQVEALSADTELY